MGSSPLSGLRIETPSTASGDALDVGERGLMRYRFRLWVTDQLEGCKRLNTMTHASLKPIMPKAHKTVYQTSARTARYGDQDMRGQEGGRRDEKAAPERR